RETIQHSLFDLVLLDQQLPDGKGIDLLDDLITKKPDSPVIMMTGHHDLELAITAIKKGAADFIHKPVATSDLDLAVDKALVNYQDASQNIQEKTLENSLNLDRELIGKSSAMLAISKEIALSAQSHASVLITGESGTGKELIAKLIHQHSSRADNPFIAVNCAAIVDNLLESELFGHEKGAFTGAVERKPGKFALAENGTLFLDEIGELALPLQAKLLRALQEQTIEPVGSTRSQKINVRVIAATNRDLFSLSREKLFREDLIYRLNVINIQLPPLRKRKEDIPLLAKAFIEKYALENECAMPSINQNFIKHLQSYDWPGNVRELNNAITHAMLHCRGGQLNIELLNLETEEASQPVSENIDEELLTLDELEARHIQKVLNHTGGHKSNTCRILGISRPALDRKIEKYQLSV
ncbi:MAG: sigma-54 dependent transcriptional regulator, partial [Gammaproteobacteria bacterium]